MNTSNCTTVEEQVEYGLGGIDPDRKIEISLKDLMYTYATIGELVRFFHQPLHYPRLENVQRFVGDKEQGALHLLWEIYYKRLRGVWPEDIIAKLEKGDFDSPQPPYYYKPDEEQ